MALRSKLLIGIERRRKTTSMLCSKDIIFLLLTVLRLCSLPAATTAFVAKPFATVPRLVMHHGKNSSSRLQVLDMNTITNLSVAETNSFLVPFFAASSLPFLLLPYFLSTRIKAFPKGATVGLAWVLVFGLLVGPTEYLTQQTYGVSFFDCDYVHGTVSSLFAVGYTTTNIALLQDLGRRDREEEPLGYGPALQYTAIAATLLLTVFLAEYLNDSQLHTPHWYGVLDLNGAWLDTSQEPANALSVATWLNHLLEISQFQMFMRLISLWGNRVGLDTSLLTWSFVPLQLGNIAIISFHLFYNQLAPLYLAFGLLLLAGNTTAAIAASVISSEEIGQNSSRLKQEPVQVDRPSVYAVKSLVIALTAAYVVKYASLEFQVADHLDLESAAKVVIPASIFVFWDVFRCTTVRARASP